MYKTILTFTFDPMDLGLSRTDTPYDYATLLRVEYPDAMINHATNADGDLDQLTIVAPTLARLVTILDDVGLAYDVNKIKFVDRYVPTIPIAFDWRSANS